MCHGANTRAARTTVPTVQSNLVNKVSGSPLGNSLVRGTAEGQNLVARKRSGLEQIDVQVFHSSPHIGSVSVGSGGALKRNDSGESIGASRRWQNFLLRVCWFVSFFFLLCFHIKNCETLFAGSSCGPQGVSPNLTFVRIMLALDPRAKEFCCRSGSCRHTYDLLYL